MEQALLEYERGAVSAFLSAKANFQYSQGDIAKSELLEIVVAIRQLSAQYVEHQAPRKLRALQAKAYALYYAPVNFAKVWHLLDQAPHLQTSTNIDILDYGCGTGTASFACAAKLPGIRSILGVDTSAVMIEAARILNNQYPKSETRTFSTDLESYKKKKFDLIVAANVFNELRQQTQREELLRSLYACLSERGTLIILEPALQQSAHQLVELRDFFVSNFPDLGILFPCTHTNPCPMRQNEKVAWCHFQMSWAPPQIVAQLDAERGFNKHRLKYAGMVMMARSITTPGLRVLTKPQKSKGMVEAYICGEANFGIMHFKSTEISDSPPMWGSIISTRKSQN
jgi:ribosomal protein RSM22 (predicted rRNA methylase)